MKNSSYGPHATCRDEFSSKQTQEKRESFKELGDAVEKVMTVQQEKTDLLKIVKANFFSFSLVPSTTIGFHLPGRLVCAGKLTS